MKFGILSAKDGQRLSPEIEEFLSVAYERENIDFTKLP